MQQFVLNYSSFVEVVFCPGASLRAESRGVCVLTLSAWLYIKECMTFVIVNIVQTDNFIPGTM